MAKFHRIVVAHGAARVSFQAFGGSGSLILDSEITGDQHTAAIDKGGKPFTIGHLDPRKGYVHVFDDISLDIILSTLDTVTDFVSYLSKKEEVLCNHNIRIIAAGEEDLLAFYLKRTNENGEHDFVFPKDLELALIEEGHWIDYTRHPQRLAQIEANKISYAWDALIEKFTIHIIDNTQYYATDPGIRSQEKILRFLAREPRTRRRFLSTMLLEIIRNTPSQGYSQRYTRVVKPSRDGDPYYVFLILTQPSNIEYDSYREVRRNFLSACCKVLKFKFPDALDIVGIATSNVSGSDFSEDAVYLDARAWTDEEQEEARGLQHDLGLLTNVTQFTTRAEEYPSVSNPYGMRGVLRAVPERKGRNRNAPCSCGSGKKYKRCCGR